MPGILLILCASEIHQRSDYVFVIDVTVFGQSIDIDNLAAVGAASLPAANEANVIGTGKDGNGFNVLSRCNVLAGGVIANKFIALADERGNFTDSAFNTNEPCIGVN